MPRVWDVFVRGNRSDRGAGQDLAPGPEAQESIAMPQGGSGKVSGSGNLKQTDGRKGVGSKSTTSDQSKVARRPAKGGAGKSTKKGWSC